MIPKKTDPCNLKTIISDKSLNLIDNSSFFHGHDPYYPWFTIEQTDLHNKTFMYILDIAQDAYYKRYKDQDNNYRIYTFIDIKTNDVVDLKKLITCSDDRYNDLFIYMEFLSPMSSAENMIKDSAIIIVDQEEYESLETDYNKQLYLFYHIYEPVMFNRVRIKKTWPKLLDLKLRQDIVPNMHWIWYRFKDTKFSVKCGRRVFSFLKLNPEIKFYLWTDMSNEEEWLSFLDDIKQNDPEVFTAMYSSIKVMYRDTLITFLKAFHKKHNVTTITSDKLIELINTWSQNTMMIKTDIIRCFILYEYGGFYSDFNDTMCFVPIKFILPDITEIRLSDKMRVQITGPDLLLGSDTNKYDANNYFMYSSKENEKMFTIITYMLKYIDIVRVYNEIVPIVSKAVFIDSQVQFLKFLLKSIESMKNKNNNKKTIKLVIFNEDNSDSVDNSSNDSADSFQEIVLIDNLCLYMKEIFLHDLANEIDSYGVSREMIETLVAHPEMFHKILQIHIWVLRECLDLSVHGSRQRQRPDTFEVDSTKIKNTFDSFDPEVPVISQICDLLVSSYINTNNVTHHTEKCKWLNIKYDKSFTGAMSVDLLSAEIPQELSKIRKKLNTLASDKLFVEKFRKYFSNNTQHVSMVRTNAGIIANNRINEVRTEPLNFYCLQNMYIKRNISLLTSCIHIGCGSAAGDSSLVRADGDNF